MAVTDTPEAPEVEAPLDDEPAPPAPWPPATDHKVVGTLFVVFAILFLIASGVLAAVMRAQLATPDGSVVGGTTYRQLFTLHGTFGVFGFLAPVWVGIATAVVPLQIGAARLAFPRLQALALWMVVAGGTLMATSPFVKGGKVVSGWSLSSPIPEGRAFRGHGPDLLILGLGLVAVALVLASANLVVTVIKMRVPGLTLRRTPLFSWSVLVSGSVMLLALPVLVGGLLMLFVDRQYNGHIFNGFTGSGGGNPLLWPRLFWFAAYPTLWALLLPGIGAVAEIVPVFARRRLFSHSRATAAIAAVGVLSFAGWGSEVTNLSGAHVLFAVGALVVLLPVASLLLNLVATLGFALKDRTVAVDELRTGPMLNAGAFIALVLVGLAGGAVAAIGAGGEVHHNYWQVATQHTLFFGASTVAVVAAITYWAPKLWGHHLSPGLSMITAVLIGGGLLLTVLPMFVLGAQDMPVHLATYSSSDHYGPAGLVSTIGALVTALGVVVLAVDLAVNVLGGRGRRADSDPWGGHTLEWATTSPPPSHNFDRIPDVRSEAPVLDYHAGSQAPEAPSGVAR